jgi:outer membrane lipoprotein-sorting protein/peroxiredoxin
VQPFIHRIIPVLLLTSLGYAQPVPDARSLLKESGDALRGLQSYEIDQQVVIEMKGGMQNHMELPVKLAVSNPGKLRIESNGQLGSTLMISDGENTWMYVGPLNQYTKIPAASNPDALIKSMNPGMGEMLEQLRAQDPYLSAKITGEESVSVGGEKFDCFVVEAALDKIKMPDSFSMSDGATKMWIDKKTKLLLKQTTTATINGGPLRSPAQMIQSTAMVSMKLNQPVADSFFVFTPPEGAKQVEAFKVEAFKAPVRATADLAGKTAADFKLKAMDGTEYGLRDLRGKVVLLDFWATWCGPCRKELPMLEKIHQEFHEKGLVLLGMNVGEDADTVGKFLLKTKLSYSILLTAATEIEQNYSVTAYPTIVLIDRAGKIVLYHVGTGSELDLRANLAALGLTPAEQD